MWEVLKACFFKELVKTSQFVNCAAMLYSSENCLLRMPHPSTHQGKNETE